MSLQYEYEDWSVPTALPDEPRNIPPEAVLITWSEKDWKWLQFFKEWCRLYPTDFVTKQVYKNYLQWYRTKSASSN